jgi:hypothetical protein
MYMYSIAALTLALGSVACGEGRDSDARLRSKRYLNKSEARDAMERIIDGAATYLREHDALPASAPMTPPLGTCCTAAALAVSQGLHEEGRKCAVDPAAWATPAWQAYGFHLDQPHRCSHGVTVTGGELVIDTRCDIDCDGTYASFQLHVWRDGYELRPDEDVAVENDTE